MRIEHKAVRGLAGGDLRRQITTMQRRAFTILLLAVALLGPALPALAQSLDDPYNIIAPEPGRRAQPQPEPWLPPKYQSPRSERLYRPPQPQLQPAPRAEVPPSIMVPETGRVLPNLRTLSPSGPNGLETGQDRAMRCAQQLGTYGADAGNPSAYLGSCVNQ